MTLGHYWLPHVALSKQLPTLTSGFSRLYLKMGRVPLLRPMLHIYDLTILSETTPAEPGKIAKTVAVTAAAEIK